MTLLAENLITCRNCGVVLDTDYLPEPVTEDQNGDIVPYNVEWDGEKYHPKYTCPVCETKFADL